MCTVSWCDRDLAEHNSMKIILFIASGSTGALVKGILDGEIKGGSQDIATEASVIVK